MMGMNESAGVEGVERCEAVEAVDDFENEPNK
jgi:hypothetical protein